MGISCSKIERSEALRLCRERKRFIKQAIDSRYALSVAHLSYVQSLRNIGISLRRFAEAEVLMESSLSTSVTELDKTPSHYSYPSPSPSHVAEIMDSPLHNGNSISFSHSTISYMRSVGSAAVTIKIEPSLMENESLIFHSPPHPPTETGSSWDFFDATDETPSFRFSGENGLHQNFVNLNHLGQFRKETGESCEMATGLKGNYEISMESKRSESQQRDNEVYNNLGDLCKGNGRLVMSNVNSGGNMGLERLEDNKRTSIGEKKGFKSHCNSNGFKETLVGNVALEQSSSGKLVVEKDSCEEREDPSEFITHRAKDFLSSIKNIENRFLRASESGKEVSRMLETNKVRSRYSEAKGRSPASILVAAFHLACCHRELASHEPPEHLTKAITWNRTTSSHSSSSKNPLASASKDDVDDSGSDFIEEFSMITGSHSSTLDRLYAWERKLYDEVKASECIRKEYDQKCDQLRHQFARDVSAQVIDKTRAVIKDLHSRIRVGLHAVDSIAKRIEKMRDEELQPQLVELIQGFIRMWKTMLECHHAQYITISLAYHAKSSTDPTRGESYRQVFANLQHEIECFGSSFADWIDAHKSYVDALNGWLQNCILLPRERFKGRRVFSPRRALAPPIFVLCRDWSTGFRALPSRDVIDAFKDFVSILHQVDEQRRKQGPSNPDVNGETENGEDGKCDKSSNLTSIQTSLTKALHQLTKFAEASLKMCEDIRQASETARIAYTNCRIPR